MGSLIEAGRDPSGQMYMRNRYYDPASGRFTQEDPIGFAGGMNLYGFAAGDPVSFSDPFGLCKKDKEENEPTECEKFARYVEELAMSRGKGIAFALAVSARDSVLVQAFYFQYANRTNAIQVRYRPNATPEVDGGDWQPTPSAQIARDRAISWARRRRSADS